MHETALSSGTINLFSRRLLLSLRRLGLLALAVPLLGLAACDAYGDFGESPGTDGPFGSAAGGGAGDAPFAGPENYDWDSVPAPELADDVVKLDEEPCFDSLEVSEDFSLTTIYLHCPADAVDIEPGDLLVTSVGSGYLLRILASEDGDYQILAQTTPGTLTDLFPDGGFFDTFALEELSRAPLQWGANNLYNADGLRLRFEGATVDLNTPQLFFGSVHSGGLVVRRDMYLRMDSSISVAVSATATAAINKTISRDLFTYSFPIRVITPTFVYVGTVQLSAKLKVKATMEAKGTLRAGMTLDTTLRVGATYNEVTDRFEDLENIEANFTPHEVTANTKRGMSIKASIDFRAELKHYSILGTYVEMGPYLKLAGAPECADLNWDLTAGWGGKVAAHLDIWGWDFNLLTVPWNQPFGGPLAEGTVPLPFSVGGEDCDPEPEPGPEPDPDPGTDPDPDPDPDPGPGPDPDLFDDIDNDGSGACTPVQELSCGQRVTGDTGSDADATSVLDGYGINVGNYEAPELVYRWNGSGPVRFRFVRPRPTQVNHDIMIIEATEESESCSEGNSLDYGFNSVLWEGSGSVFVVVDGYYNNSGAFELEVDCSP
jgi:hypothetical protein